MAEIINTHFFPKSPNKPTSGKIVGAHTHDKNNSTLRNDDVSLICLFVSYNWQNRQKKLFCVKMTSLSINLVFHSGSPLSNEITKQGAGEGWWATDGILDVHKNTM